MKKDRGWNSLDKIIVEILCTNSFVSSFHLYEQLGFSPLSIADSAARLEEFGVAVRSGDKIERSPVFFDRLLTLRHDIYNRKMPWKDLNG